MGLSGQTMTSKSDKVFNSCLLDQEDIGVLSTFACFCKKYKIMKTQGKEFSVRQSIICIPVTLIWEMKWNVLKKKFIWRAHFSGGLRWELSLAHASSTKTYMDSWFKEGINLPFSSLQFLYLILQHNLLMCDYEVKLGQAVKSELQRNFREVKVIWITVTSLELAGRATFASQLWRAEI